MFGEICDGLALGAGHRTTVTKLPTHMDLNATFMRSTGAWARPDYPNEGYYGGPTVTLTRAQTRAQTRARTLPVSLPLPLPSPYP